MAGLDPAIYVWFSSVRENVDGRVKPVHDGIEWNGAHSKNGAHTQIILRNLTTENPQFTLRSTNEQGVQSFSWDEAKAAANWTKHGVSFAIAQTAFDDPQALEFVDTDMAYGERRYRMIASADGTILVIVYTERGDQIRLISARRATMQERERYVRQDW